MEKHWWFKNWQMDNFPPDSPMLAPSKVSLHTVSLEDRQYIMAVLEDSVIADTC